MLFEGLDFRLDRTCLGGEEGLGDGAGDEGEGADPDDHDDNGSDVADDRCRGEVAVVDGGACDDRPPEGVGKALVLGVREDGGRADDDERGDECNVAETRWCEDAPKPSDGGEEAQEAKQAQ